MGRVVSKTSSTSIVDTLQFNKDLTPIPSYSEGLVYYDSINKSLNYYNEEADVTVNIGQELLIRVKNNTGSTITNGSVVYPSGNDAGVPEISLATSNFEDRSKIVGVTTHDIEDGTIGYVTKFGEVRDVDTSAFTAGDIVYLGETPGSLTVTKPVGGNFLTAVGVIEVADASNGILFVDIVSSQFSVEVTDTNGFPTDQRAGTTISFVDGTRTFTITPTGSNFHYYMNGIKYENDTAKSVVIDNTEGLHAIYFDSETLTSLANPNTGQIDTVIRTKAIVSYVYWNATAGSHNFLADERHGISMSPETHSYLHFTRGAQYLEGLALNSILAGENGSLASHAQFGVDAGVITDEDIITSVSAVASTTGLKIFYLSGSTGNLRTITQSGFSVVTDVTAGVGTTGLLVWNENTGATWQLTTVTSGKYVLCHVLATNGNTNTDSIIAFIGQNQYDSVGKARAGAETEISSLVSRLLIEEKVPVATIIFETRSSFANSVKARIITTAEGDNYVDWRTSELKPGAAPASHNNLAGLDLAASGITYGHIDDQTQSIAGAKTFTSILKAILATEQFRVGYDSSNYFSMTVNSSGKVVYSSTSSLHEFDDTIAVNGTPGRTVAGTNSTTIGVIDVYDTSKDYGTTIRLINDSSTTGWILFSVSSTFTQINRRGNFEFYDIASLTPRFIIDSEGRFGVGTGYTQPFVAQSTFQSSTRDQIRLSNSVSVYTSLKTDSSGRLTITPTGSLVTIGKVAANGSLFIDTTNFRIGVKYSPTLCTGGGAHLESASAGTISSVNSSADELVIEGSGDSGMTILSGGSSKSVIYFGDSAGVTSGGIEYDHSSDTLNLRVNGSTQTTISSTGVVTSKILKITNIKSGATQAAAGAAADEVWKTSGHATLPDEVLMHGV